jgi:DNA-binding MarR family transcriptional regulator
MKLEEALQMTKFADETHKATLNILYTAYWMKNQFSACIKGTGLTTEQFNVMRILKGKHPEKMCVKDIGSRIIEKNSNVPRIIDRLLSKDLVGRVSSEVDKRETLIYLTEKGLELLVTANNLLNEHSEHIIGINNADAAILNELLEKIRKVD